MPVEVVHFNPLRRQPGLLGRFRPKRPLNNFGDLIGPVIVGEIVKRRRLEELSRPTRLLAVGSIMRMSRPGDTVWGAGVNGKSMDAGAAPNIDVRAVRGPRTAKLLRELGTSVPDVYGDPALLWPHFWPLESYRQGVPDESLRDMSVVPNLYDRDRMTGPHLIDPLQDPFAAVREIALSNFVCGSSLHGIVIAEAFGIPARLIQPGTEPDFKYDDYYRGTGRSTFTPAKDVEEAIRMGGERPARVDSAALLEAFPDDLWTSS